MPLPENISANIEKELTKKRLLDPTLAKEVIGSLGTGKPIKWNLLLAKQLELEKGEANEAHD
jgi:hypothetical protein